MTEPRLITRNGRLTNYALACGYVERRYSGHERITLWKEHHVFHVRGTERHTGKRTFWLSFDKLSDARKCFFGRRKPASGRK